MLNNVLSHYTTRRLTIGCVALVLSELATVLLNESYCCTNFRPASQFANPLLSTLPCYRMSCHAAEWATSLHSKLLCYSMILMLLKSDRRQYPLIEWNCVFLSPDLTTTSPLLKKIVAIINQIRGWDPFPSSYSRHSAASWKPEIYYRIFKSWSLPLNGLWVEM
jgi:hypothetical protein